MAREAVARGPQPRRAALLGSCAAALGRLRSRSAVKLVRPILAHLVAVAPALATWHEPARASLASLSLLGWALAVQLGFALVPEARAERSRTQAGLATLASALPALALGFGLDVQAGFALPGLLALAAVGSLSLALVGAAAPQSEREERAVLASGALLVLLPALLLGALVVCGIEHDGLARALLASPLASALEATLQRVEPRALALAPLGALAVLGIALLAARKRGDHA